MAPEIELIRERSPAVADAEQAKAQQRAHALGFAFMVSINAFVAAEQHLHQLQAQAGADWWKDDDAPWNALSDRGQMLEGLDRLEHAAERYAQAIQLLEDRRGRLRRDELKVALVGGKGAQALYLHAAPDALKCATAVENNDARSAMRWTAQSFDDAERGKARGLLDLMSNSGSSFGASALTATPLRAWRQTSPGSRPGWA